MMLGKPFAVGTPALPFATKALCAVGLVAQIAGCSPNAGLAETEKKLEQANQRIAALEAQLANAPAPTPVAPAPATAIVQDAPAPAAAASAPTQEPETVTGQQWRYNVVEEEMTGGKRKMAAVESTNTVEFDFPYSGSQHGHLTLRTDPRHGKDVIFRIEKGQILCPSYQGCSVQVRFDDEKPSNFAASGAADHSSDVIFLDDYARFLAKLKKAKRVRLAVNIYQQGTPVFEFDVSGFSFDRYQAKS